MDLSKLSKEEKAELLNKLSEEIKADNSRKKEAFEAIRSQFIQEVKSHFMRYLQDGRDFKNWLRGESETYYEVLKEYGKLKRDDQMGFTVQDENFKMQVKGNKVKGFDDRADIAEKRLVAFLDGWIESASDGVKNPMYKLAMMMIRRNGEGDLDYKSISKLHELKPDFNSEEYNEIMDLFDESNTTEKTIIYFTFEQKNAYNEWEKAEPSFNKL